MSQYKYDILSCGLAVCDIIASPLDRTVFEVDTAYLKDINYSSGGDALNVAVACAKMGAEVAMGGSIGKDMPGDFLCKKANEAGIDTSFLTRLDNAGTATSLIFGESSGERHFAYYPGANLLFDGENITDEILSQTKLIYIGSAMALGSLDGEPLANLFCRAKKLGVTTAMDATSSTDGVWLPKIEKALCHTDIFIPSVYEGSNIFGTENPEQIYKSLKAYGVKIAGVKLGKEGVYVEGNYIPAFECERVVDTTGAGDCFMAAFCNAYIKGEDVIGCSLIGSAASNFCIRKTGATTGIPQYEDIKALADKYKNKLFN